MIGKEILKTILLTDANNCLSKCNKLIEDLKKDLVEVHRLRDITLHALSIMDEKTNQTTVQKAKEILPKLDKELKGAQERLARALHVYNSVDEDIDRINTTFS